MIPEEHLLRAIVDECDKSVGFKVMNKGSRVGIEIDLGDKLDIDYSLCAESFSKIKNELESIKLKKLAEAGKGH